MWGNENNYSWLFGVQTAGAIVKIISIAIFIFILEIYIFSWPSGSIFTTSISYFALICILAFTDSSSLSLSVYHLIRVNFLTGTSFSLSVSQIGQICSTLHPWASGYGFVIDCFLYWCWLHSERVCQEDLSQAGEIDSVLDSS